MDIESLLYWFYVIVMAAGAIIFITWSRDPRGVPQYEYLIATVIPIWSGLAYMSLALDQAKISVDGQTTYYARYIDWVVTTPLLLLSLSLMAMHKRSKSSSDYTLIAALMATDVIMIVCGLVADLSPTPIRYLWYSLGVVAFLVAMVLIWVPLRDKARTNPKREIDSIYPRVAGLLTILWIGYPLIWLIGPSGFGLVNQLTDTVLFVTLPIISKVGFSLYDLSLLRSLAPAEGRAAPARGRVRTT